jgi:predicted acylesterase/phospholipase RssA
MKAVVMSGGGLRGALQVGTLIGLSWDAWESDDGEGEPVSTYDLPWDFAYGVSTGALQAAGIAGGKYGDLVRLADVWTDLRKFSDLFGKKWYWPLNAIFGKSLWDMKPVTKKVEKMYDPRNQRILTHVGVVDLVSGEFRIYDGNHPNIREKIIASASIPGVFPPIYGDGVEVDGGVRDVSPLKGAIDAGADQIDVILTEPYRGAGGNGGELKKTYQIAMGAIATMQKEIFTNDLKICNYANQIAYLKDNNYRFVDVTVYEPDKEWFANLNIGTLEVNHGKIMEQIRHGIGYMARNGVKLENFV